MTGVRVRPARIVLTTVGSLGDLHPYLALASGLQARGHHPVVATCERYRSRVEQQGLSFHPVRPDMPDIESNPELMRRIMDQRGGPECVIREYAMPALQQAYDDTLAAVDGADLIVSHPITFATRLVAEKRGLPWASVMLAPLGFFSAHDPSVPPAIPHLDSLRFLGPGWFGMLMRLARWSVRHWSAPWHQFRAELGLPPLGVDPLFEGQHSPRLVLAMFSGLLGGKQCDWPSQTQVTGFPFHDRDDHPMSVELMNFLDSGPAPLVFTLGSAAVHDAGRFYEESAAAARALRRRAVLLLGKDTGNRLSSVSPDIHTCEYAPFTVLFPRAAAIIHQGGVGTTAQAMRSGRPMLVMPYSHDQPDNAARVRRLGIARTISRHRYHRARVTAELHQLLTNPHYARRAAEVGRQIRAEDGVGNACRALEGVLTIRATHVASLRAK